jgi:putative two-component system response regulator
MNMSEESRNKRVLVVDDVPENIAIVANALKEMYKIQTALSGEAALDLVIGAKRKPDLILLDVQMPGIDGYEVCRRLKNDTGSKDIPVIFLTSLHDNQDETHGFLVGAVDYIHKPCNPSIVKVRVAIHLNLKEAHDQLAHQKLILEMKVEERTREIALVQSVTIGAMAALAEARDNETGNHIIRTQHYIERLACQLSSHPQFEAMLTPRVIELLSKSAALHDIGKVGIPDRILLKPGPLDYDEFEIMKTHARIGAIAIMQAEKQLSSSDTFLSYAREIACHHHEKWDGSGYPEGLAREAIPVSARLMAIADVYDALISDRVYKRAFSHDKSIAIIREGSGRHFDPVAVDGLVAIADDMQEIAQSFKDEVK